MKKLLASLLCVMMVVVFMPTFAFADGEAVDPALDTPAPASDMQPEEAEQPVVQEVADADALKDAIAKGGEIKLTAAIDLDADDTITVTSDKEVTLDLNKFTITGVSDQTGKNRDMIDVRGTLTVKNGTVTIEHEGENMGWNNSTNVFNVTAGGILNIENATIENLGGSDMAFCVHLNNWGEVTLNVGNSNLKSTYIAVRAFNSGNDMNNITIKNSTLEGKYCFWVHNYTLVDFGNDSAKQEAHAKLLNLDITNGTNTFVNTGMAPILYGFTDSIYFDASGNELVTDVDGLKAAIAAGGEVVLGTDFTLENTTLTIAKGTDVTINLNGHKIDGVNTASGTSALIKNDGTLTLTGEGKISVLAEHPDTDWDPEGFPTYASNTIANSGTLTIGSGVTVENETVGGGASYAVDNYAGATLTVNGSTIKQSGGDVAIRLNTASATAANTVTINDGIIGGKRAFWIHLAGSSNATAPVVDLTIKKGTFTATGADSSGNTLALYAYSYGNSYANTKITIEGGTFNGGVDFGGGYKGDAENVTISGGKFTVAPGRWVTSDTFADFTKEDSKITVSGKIYKFNNGTYQVAASAPTNTTNYKWVEKDGIFAEEYVAPSTGGYVPSDPAAPKDDVVTNTNTNTSTDGTTTVAPTTNANVSSSTTTTKTETGEVKAETTVDQTVADKIVDKAVENKSEEVVIDATTVPATGTTGTATAPETTEAAVVIPTETIEQIAEKTEAAVTIKTDVAEITLDNTAAAAIAEQAADNGTISIVAVKTDEVVVEEETAAGETEKVTEVHFELKVVCSERGVIGDFQGGTVTVTVPVPKDMHTEELVCVYIDEQGHYHRVPGVKNANGTYSFTTTHFSDYAVMTAEEAEAAIEAQKEAIKDIKFKLKSKLVTRKNGKKAVKLTWSGSDVDFDGIEIYRSLKKSSGYGKKPIFVTEKDSYTNTAVEKGTKYYYKARGFVTIDGEKVYTQYSYKAWRTVK